ncbi:MAG: hypothetical protein U5L01_05010 [Rheinheimera sp.]|nr:hypothetical protein [Rheinheimera sp.]
MRQVERLQKLKPPFEASGDRISVRCVLLPRVALVTLLSLGGDWLSALRSDAIINAVSVLVIACSLCAWFSDTRGHNGWALAPLAKLGILVKDVSALERAQSISMVVFDKTGTLTEGQPTLRYYGAVDTHNDGRNADAVAVLSIAAKFTPAQ